MATFTIRCRICDNLTTKAYARKHEGRCKECVTGEAPTSRTPSRQERIIEHGWDAYTREEGHYDLPDYA